MRNKRLGLLIAILLLCIECLFAQNNRSNKATPAASAPNVQNNTIAVPQAFNSALDSLVYSYYAKHAKKGRCKRVNDVNIEYSDTVYKKRLANLPYEIGMPYNNAVRSFIDFYAVKKRRQVENMLGLGKYYFPIFEDILNKYDIPMEFKYLPVIESALNTGAVSPVGAAGLWQFMPSTAKMYGLEVNSLVDERRDPIKASHAAALYLKDLHRIYGDWHLAIAAYNCGPGTINKAIRRSGGKKDYWSLYPYLPAETRSYVPIFIAANYIMNYYSNHNLCPAEIDMPIYTDSVRVEQKALFSEVSKSLDIPIEDLEVLNPQYRKDIIPGGGVYYLRLPTHYASKFIQYKDSIYAHSSSTNVQSARGDDGEEDEVAYAPIRNTHSRGFKGKGGAVRGKKNRRSSVKNVSYKVRKGDNLIDIANKYNVNVSDVKKWNGIRKNKIMAGQRITIRK
jgi:membrane-bound lytic murein transglycosylase D